MESNNGVIAYTEQLARAMQVYLHEVDRLKGTTNTAAVQQQQQVSNAGENKCVVEHPVGSIEYKVYIHMSEHSSLDAAVHVTVTGDKGTSGTLQLESRQDKTGSSEVHEFSVWTADVGSLYCMTLKLVSHFGCACRTAMCASHGQHHQAALVPLHTHCVLNSRACSPCCLLGCISVWLTLAEWNVGGASSTSGSWCRIQCHALYSTAAAICCS